MGLIDLSPLFCVIYSSLVSRLTILSIKENLIPIQESRRSTYLKVLFKPTALIITDGTLRPPGRGQVTNLE